MSFLQYIIPIISNQFLNQQAQKTVNETA